MVNSSPGAYKKVLIVGIDAMDPKIIDQLMAENLLPNFLRLKKLGNFSILKTSLPAETPVAWTTAATGTNPGKHGLVDFIIRDPKTYTPEISITKQKSRYSTAFESPVKGTSFWTITSNAGIPTTVIRWPATFPAGKVNGAMFSGLGTPDIRGFESAYYIYTSEPLRNASKASIITVSAEGGIIHSKIFGPLGTDAKPVEKPIQIKTGAHNATIIVDGREYPINESGWSDWIEINFNMGFMRKVSAITKAYLFTSEPEFKMYLTAIQIDPKNPVIDISYPSSYSKELADKIGFYYTLGMPEDTNALNDNAITDNVFLEQIAQIEDERNKMFWYEFEKFNKKNTGVFAFGFDSGDRLQHMNWDDKILFNVTEGLSINPAVVDYYVKKDEFLGKVLDSISNDTALIIFSDHGFTSFERSVSINTWLADNNFMSLTDDYNAADGDDGVLFKFVNWKETKAYAVGFSGIYINLKGREGQGIVDAADKEKLEDEIIKKLKELKDPKTNKTIIAHVYKREDVYAGSYINDSPDIIIGFEPGYRMNGESVIGGLTPEIITDNTKKWDGDHIVDPSNVPGILFTNFKINHANPELADISPTILSIMRLKIPPDVEGKSLI